MVEKWNVLVGSVVTDVSNRVGSDSAVPSCNFTAVGVAGSPVPGAYPYTPSRCAPWTEQKSVESASMRNTVAITKGLLQPLLRHFDIHNRTKVATWLGGMI